MSPRRASGIAVSLVASLFLAQASCDGPRPGLGATEGRPMEAQPVSDAIRAIVDGSRPLARRSSELTAVREGLAALYAPDWAPRWIAGRRPGPGAQHAVGLLTNAGAAGLVPEDYDAAWLERRRVELSEASASDAEDLASFDTALSMQLLRFLRAIHTGRVVPAQVGFAYHVDMRGMDLGERLKRATTGAELDRLVAELEPDRALGANSPTGTSP